MKLFSLAYAAILLLGGCANHAYNSGPTPVNPSVPYSSERGPGSIGSPPFQQGSVPTGR